LPAMVVGTRLDAVGTGAPLRCQLADDLGCASVYVNTRAANTAHSEGQLAHAIDRFFHAMIDRRAADGRGGGGSSRRHHVGGSGTLQGY
jgi:hypothetical protein